MRTACLAMPSMVSLPLLTVSADIRMVNIAAKWPLIFCLTVLPQRLLSLRETSMND